MLSTGNYFKEDDRGFILMAVLFTLVLLTLIALSMNQSGLLRLAVSANYKEGVQRTFGAMAGIEQAVWKLKQQTNWRTGRYTDLTFIATNDKIQTAAGDFLADGFKAGDQIVVVKSAPYNDGFYTIQNIGPGNTMKVTPALPASGGNGRGSATIARLSGGMKVYGILTFTKGLSCADDTITTAGGNFSTDGFKRGDRIAIVNSSPNNDGVYAISNDVPSQPATIRLAKGSLKNGGTGSAKIAVLRGERYVYNNREYERTVRDSSICGTGSFISVSVLPLNGQKAVSELISMNTWSDYYIADALNHRIRNANASTNTMTTAAGNSSPERLSAPAGVCLDPIGNIYIADTVNNKVRRIDFFTGALSVAAGNGSGGYSGDDGPATSASLKTPYAVSTDGYGNLYIADTGNKRIRKVDAGTGNITTVAGTGVQGYSGDGGPATAANMQAPYGVHADVAGNIYIADTANHRIRRVDAATGTIQTVAGNGSGGYWGDAFPAAQAQIDTSCAVQADGAGNIYIADTNNSRIRKVFYDAYHQQWLIKTVAGNGSAGYSGDGLPAAQAQIKSPNGLWLDGAGNIFIADTGNHRIRKVDAGTGIITTVAGNGSGGYLGDNVPATGTRLNAPQGVYADAAGNIFIADTGNSRIRKVAAGTGLITTVAGNGVSGYLADNVPATGTPLNKPSSVYAATGGDIYLADTGNSRIRKVAAETGIITTVAGNGVSGYLADNVPATGTPLNKPAYVFTASGGDIYLADTGNSRIRKVAAGTGLITTVAGNGVRGYLGDNVPATGTPLNQPQGVHVDGAGNLYLADTGNNRIRRVAAGTGLITTVAGNGAGGYWGDADPATKAQLKNPAGVYVDAAGDIYIADMDNNRIRKVHAATGYITTMAGNGDHGYLGDGVLAASTSLNAPQGVWANAAGNISIADTANYRIRRVDAATGIISTVAGNGSNSYSGDGEHAVNASINIPYGVFLDGAGNILIADTGNDVVRKVYADTGLITTIAGEVSGGYSGDGIPAVSTKLYLPTYVHLDPSLNIFIADSLNNRVRKVNGQTGIISTIAGNGVRGYGGDNGPATDASLFESAGLYVDVSGNILIADTGNNRIRKVDYQTGIITTVAGDGSAGYAGDNGPATFARIRAPEGVSADSRGNIYIADTGNNRIRRVDYQTGIITTAVGDGSAGYAGDNGPATLARIRGPGGLSMDNVGNMFIADTGNNRIRMVSFQTGMITTLAGNGTRAFAGDNGPATSASLNLPQGVGIDAAANLYIADTGNNRIRMVASQTGIITTLAGNGDAQFSGDGDDPSHAKLYSPKAVWVSPEASGGSIIR